MYNTDKDGDYIIVEDWEGLGNNVKLKIYFTYHDQRYDIGDVYNIFMYDYLLPVPKEFINKFKDELVEAVEYEVN